MDENQSELAIPDITEAEHLGSNEENDHENGDQVNEFIFTICAKINFIGRWRQSKCGTVDDNRRLKCFICVQSLNCVT